MIDTSHKGFESQELDVSFVRNLIIITDSHTRQMHHRHVVSIASLKTLNIVNFNMKYLAAETNTAISC